MMMIKYKYISLFVFILLSYSYISCNDDDFENKPQAIDVNSIELTPQAGAVLVKWTPPADTNFEFLNVSLTDQDNNTRSHNSSRYFAEGDDTKTKSLLIDKLISQNYKFNFYAYNNDNKSIHLGSRDVTPLDHTNLIPDLATGVKIETDRNRAILKWAEPKIHSYSTYEGIRFIFKKEATDEIVETKSYKVSKQGYQLRIDSVDIAPDMYDITVETYSKKDIIRLDTIFASVEILEYYRLNRTEWTVQDISTEEASGEGVGNGIALCVLDGRLNTFWHSKWSGGTPPLPHSFVIDMKKVYNVTRLGMHQRAGNNKDTKAGEIHISDDAVTWTKISDYNLERINGYQNINVTHTKGRYLKIVVTESYRGNNASLAEILVYADNL